MYENLIFLTFIVDANQKLEMSVESLSNMKQECDSLREELRVLSEKLLKQHDAALESQVLRMYFHLASKRTVEFYVYFSLLCLCCNELVLYLALVTLTHIIHKTHSPFYILVEI